MDEKIRVCRVTDSFPPPWTGLNPGPYELSKAQSVKSIDLEVITKYRRGAEDVDKKLNFKIHRIKAKSYIFEILAIYKLLMLHKKKEFDIIHSHGTSIFLFQLFRKMFPKIPFVLSVHCVRKAQFNVLRNNNVYKILEKELKKSFFLNKLRFKMSIRNSLNPRILKEKICFLNADKLLAVSYGIATELKDSYNLSNKIIIIGNGVNLEEFKFKNGQLKANDELSNHKYILFVGMLNERKNVVNIIRAFSLVVEALPEVRLRIIGEGKWRRYLMNQSCHLGINDKVEFLGYVSYKEIKYFYYNSDVFVLTSYYEGLPKVLLEAMACGMPVIATNIKGNNELIQDGYNGYLIDLNNPALLADRISYLLRSETLMRKMGIRNRNIVEKNFSWDKIVVRLNKIYNNLIKNPP